MPQLLIRHPKTRAEYEISSADYRRGKHWRNADGEGLTFEEAGFEIVSQADGTPYEGPLTEPPPAERKAD